MRRTTDVELANDEESKIVWTFGHGEFLGNVGLHGYYRVAGLYDSEMVWWWTDIGEVDCGY